LLLDEAPSHTAKASVRVSEGMTLLWLPNRSPELTGPAHINVVGESGLP
jgi:hypothetical protein